MNRSRLRQLTDNIHDTIYLSELESNMASTPVFYRLNDVYQSSTVYLTFPANRTKRYEHSMGTMQLAAEMFYYAVANADENKVFAPFLKEVKKEFVALYRAIEKNPRDNLPIYSIEAINEYISCHEIPTGETVRRGKYRVDTEFPEDKALRHYVPHLPEKDYRFYYICVLEAIRIAALFHDAGHPPFSHIIEHVLNELYGEIDNISQNERTALQGICHACLSELKRPDRSCRYIAIPKGNEEKDLHESIGLTFLQNAFDTCYKKMIPSSQNEYIPYYIAVYEFTFAILENKSTFWTGLHRIIDGPFDADRLDYVLRDCRNSGVDWGGIPYKRILESAKLIKNSKKSPGVYPYQVAFPQKISDDIDDILLMRYKIFSRINSNHRTLKTAALLQKSVYLIAKEYLNLASDAEAQNNWANGIEELWTFSKVWGYKNVRISKWNDSWLISKLQDFLSDLTKKLTVIRDEDEKRRLDNIKACLESILLNYTHYYCVIKRGADMTKIYQSILKDTITVEMMENHLAALRRWAEDKSKGIIAAEVKGKSSDELSGALDSAFTKIHAENVSETISKLETIIWLIHRRDYGLVFTMMGVLPWDEVKAKIQNYDDGYTKVLDCILEGHRVKSGIESLVVNPRNSKPEIIPLYTADDSVIKYDVHGIEATIDGISAYSVPVRFFVRFSPECRDIKGSMEKIHQIVLDTFAECFKTQYEKSFGNPSH